MKSLLTFAVFGVLLSSQAHAVQFFQCWDLPLDPYSNERTVISLTNDSVGTLFLSSGLDDNGDQDSTGPLKLEKVLTSRDNTVWVAKNTTSTFTVTIPNSVVGHMSDDVTLDLDLQNDSAHVSMQISCYTRMY